MTESGFALAHGVTTIIDEVFLPDYGVACNIEWTTTPEFERVPWRLRVFPATSERLSKADHVSDVFLPSRLAMSIVELASQQSALAKQVLALGLLLSEPSWGGVDQAVSK